MNEIIFTYPGLMFVALATRKPAKTLNHFAFALVNHLPKLGDTFEETLPDKKVVELLTDEELLKERSLHARVKIEAVAVLAKQV
jgi:hypothetical protein